MYRKKSEIIGTIQSYHAKVADLYHKIYENEMDPDAKKIMHELYEHEKFRVHYLEKHRKIAEAMNCHLEFPCEALLEQIDRCFINVNPEAVMTLNDIIRLELHFDDCLIKLYAVLSSENELNATLANTFYYMLKKTKKEEAFFASLLHNGQKDIGVTIRQLNT
ncbi:MAG: hypothetical protein ACP5F6_06280 [Microbacter sp.]